MSADRGIVLQSSHAFQPSYSRDRHFYWFCPCMTMRYGEKGSFVSIGRESSHLKFKIQNIKSIGRESSHAG